MARKQNIVVYPQDKVSLTLIKLANYHVRRNSVNLSKQFQVRFIEMDRPVKSELIQRVYFTPVVGEGWEGGGGSIPEEVAPRDDTSDISSEKLPCPQKRVLFNIGVRTICNSPNSNRFVGGGGMEYIFGQHFRCGFLYLI